MSKPYMADISFLQPVIDAYKYGAFDGRNLPPRVMNALDSLSWYGNVKVEQTRLSAFQTAKVRSRKKYTKRSDYWSDLGSNKRNKKV